MRRDGRMYGGALLRVICVAALPLFTGACDEEASDLRMTVPAGDYAQMDSEPAVEPGERIPGEREDEPGLLYEFGPVPTPGVRCSACVMDASPPEDQGTARCLDWVCQPGKSCADDVAVHCSDDGLVFVSMTPCDDGNECTTSSCDPEAGCVSTPVPDGEPCDDQSSCLQGVCQGCGPDCADAECGDDGCGGTCGECGSGECLGGLCLAASTSCDGDADCEDDEVCLPFAAEDQPGTMETLCSSVFDGWKKVTGETCTTGAECISGYCDGSPPQDEAHCWGACQQDSDCPGDLFCYPDRLHFSFGLETQTVHDDSVYGIPGCLPYLGSFEPCQWHSDCAWDEWCESLLDQTGTGFDYYCVLG